MAELTVCCYDTPVSRFEFVIPMTIDWSKLKSRNELPSVDLQSAFAPIPLLFIFFFFLLSFGTFNVAIVSPVGGFHPTGAGRFPTC